MLSRHPSGTRIPHTDTSCANTNITAATQITHTDTSSANTNITAATQITRIDTSFANTNITAATQITPTDTSSANTNITAATQITPTDTSSAKTNVPAATQITHTDTSSADTNITAATQITPTDTFSANTNITAATQITLTDTSSANTNITAATQITRIDTSSADTNITATTQITPTDTSSANTNITAATRLNSTQFLDPSRRTRHCGEPYGTTANGCGRLRPKTQNLANTASPPDPQVKREPSLRIREKEIVGYKLMSSGSKWISHRVLAVYFFNGTTKKADRNVHGMCELLLRNHPDQETEGPRQGICTLEKLHRTVERCFFVKPDFATFLGLFKVTFEGLFKVTFYFPINYLRRILLLFFPGVSSKPQHWYIIHIEILFVDSLGVKFLQCVAPGGNLGIWQDMVYLISMVQKENWRATRFVAWWWDKPLLRLFEFFAPWKECKIVKELFHLTQAVHPWPFDFSLAAFPTRDRAPWLKKPNHTSSQAPADMIMLCTSRIIVHADKYIDILFPPP